MLALIFRNFNFLLCIVCLCIVFLRDVVVLVKLLSCKLAYWKVGSPRPHD